MDGLITVDIIRPLQMVADYSKHAKCRMLIGCDSNAHSPTWGDKSLDDRGEAIEEFLLNNPIKVDNVGDTPTFSAKIGETIIDLTISSMEVEVTDWVVNTKVQPSDHRMITFNVKLDSNKVIKTRQLKKVDWNIFSAKLINQPVQRHPSEVWTTRRLDKEVCALEDRIINSLDEVAPLRQVRFNTKPQKRDNKLTSARATFMKAKKIGRAHV